MDGSEQHWFALQVKPRHEKAAALALRHKGYEEFLPLYTIRRRWSDRFKELEAPLFPSYVFCQFNALDRLPILTTPGVARIIGIGKTPVPVAEAEIAAVRAIVKSGLPAQPWPFLKIGQFLRIEDGPLAGLEGILLDFRNSHLVVSVTLLQRSVAVEIDRLWVSPVAAPRRPPAIAGAGPVSLIRSA